MTHPPLEPLDDDVAALLAAERSAPPPPDAVRDRVWMRVSDTVAAGFAGPGAPAVDAAVRTWRHVVMAGLVSGGLGLGGGALLHAALSTPEVRVVNVDRVIHVPVPTPAAPSPPEVAPPAPVAAANPPRTTNVARPSPAEARADAPSDGPRLEAALLERARTALLRGDAPQALGVLDSHASRFPAGTFSEERDALRVQALARAGNAEDARVAAHDFLARYPGSLHRRTVEEALRP